MTKGRARSSKTIFDFGRFRFSLPKGVGGMALVGLMVCFGLSGCAFAADGKESAGDSGQNTTRVNVWPLFYQRGDDLDLLWPIYHQSNAGHRVFPLYSYRKDPAWVNMVQGVLGELDFGNQDYRILNFGWDNLKQSRYCFPVFYQNDLRNELCVFPLFYREKKDKDKPATWITLPYSQGPDFFNIGGVLFHFEKSPVKRAMWAAAGMFYNQARVDGSSRTNRLFPLWSWKRRGPADAPDKTNLNVGLVAYVQRTEKEGNRAYRSILFPLTHCWTSDQEKGSAVFPLYYDQKKTNGDHARVTPLSLSYKKGETSWDSIGGLFHFWSLDRSTGHMLLPFYSLATLKGGGHRFNSLFYNEERSPEKKATNFGGPLFYTSDKSGDSYQTVLWPFFQQWNSDKNQTRTNLLFPLFLSSKKGEKEVSLTPVGGWWKDKRGHGSWLLPLYAAKSGERESYLYTLPYAAGVELGEKPEQTRHWKSVGSRLIGYFERQGTERKFRSLLGLIGHDSDSEEKTFNTWVKPLFEVSESRFNSIPFDYWNDKPSQEKLDKMTAEAREKAEKNEGYWGSQGKGWRVGVVGHEKNTVVRGEVSRPLKEGEKPQTEVTVRKSSESYLYPICDVKQTEGVSSETTLLPEGLLWKNTWNGDPDGGERTESTLLPGGLLWKNVWNGDKDGGERTETTLLPWGLLWKSEWNASKTDGVSAESKVLPWGLLWKSQTKSGPNQEESEQVRRQFLWKAVDYKRTGEKTSVDAFPFLAWDKDSEHDSGSFSFMGPIFRKSRQKEQSQWQIFWMKFGEDLEGK